MGRKVLYLYQAPFVSRARAAEAAGDLFGVRLSAGSVSNFQDMADRELAGFAEAVKPTLCSAATRCRVSRETWSAKTEPRTWIPRMPPSGRQNVTTAEAAHTSCSEIEVLHPPLGLPRAWFQNPAPSLDAADELAAGHTGPALADRLIDDRYEAQPLLLHGIQLADGPMRPVMW
ncbi:MAG: hypothetical protein LBD77_02540 [Bifidobacteriaceae bacterium]|nr:hypothetical protein [Bifidobacteriaceae bacterium]